MEIKLTGKKIVWGIVILVVLVAIGLWAWTEVASSKDANGPSPYSAVYLTSGDIYFGKLSWFPQPHLTDVWYLQRAADASGQSQISVAPLKNVFWGPVNEITLNQSQILFWTRLSNASQLVNSFENPQTLSGQAPPPVAGNGSGATSTNDLNGPSKAPVTK